MERLTFFKQNKSALILILLSIIGYSYIGYFLERNQFTLLTTIYLTLGICAYLLLQNNTLSSKQLSYLAFGFRAIFIFAIPCLSQDFYRFIWDGRLINEGINPYIKVPNEWIALVQPPINDAIELHKNMGALSAKHFSNYPPINQLCFTIATFFNNTGLISSVIGLRLIIILSDFGILVYGQKLLSKLNLNVKNIYWYILNPFIIIEISGNLHFESVMICLLLISLYLLQRNKWILSAVFVGLSISTKLIPLIFLPLYFWWFFTPNSWLKSISKLISFYLIIIGTFIVSFTPFITQQLIANYTKTVGLWFGNFEFNASLYYIFRYIGTLITGYNEIAIISKVTSLTTILIVLLFTFFKKNNTIEKLCVSMLFSLTIYFFLTATVHPWYISTLLLLSIFTKYRFTLIWSASVILSYYAYSTASFKENNWLLLIEYGVVFLFLIKELRSKNSLFVLK